jgi:biotin transport system ATP-binding protein
MPLIEVEDVTHVYGARGRPVLEDLNLVLTEQRVGIVGANGSGKSTFARLLNGLVVPTRGSVRVDGLDTRADAGAIRRRVGFVFTNPDAQIVMPTVSEDVAFGLRRHGLDRRELQQRVDTTLERYGLLQHRDHPAHLLSGGQKQLLALASILVTDPDVLVLDEPTTLLDLGNTRRITQTIAALPQQVVLVTHQLDLLEGWDRVLVFDGGRVVADDVPARALGHYRGLVW